jgi:ABC-type nitrate/sulfonate/bicarbonate transport system substrate-binding protein
MPGVRWEPGLLSRRDVLKLGLAGVGGLALADLIVACGPQGAAISSSPSAPVTVKVQIGVQNVEFAGMFAADAQGYLTKRNVTQDLLAYGPNVQPITVVAGGSALVGVIGGADSFLKARASGIPVVAIGVMFQKAPAGLLSLAKNPIRTPKDAVGKRIGLQAGARGPWSTIVKLNNLKESDFTIIPVQFDPTPLVNGQVDGFWSFAFNQPLVLKSRGLDVVFMTAFDAGYKFYGDVLFTTTDNLKSGTNALARWLAAVAQGWTYAFDHTDEIAKLTANRSPSLNLDVTQQTNQLKAEKEFMTSDVTAKKGLFWMEQSVWQTGIDILRDQNALEKPITAAEVINTSVLEQSAKLK